MADPLIPTIDRHAALYEEFSETFRAAWFFANQDDVSERKINKYWHEIVVPIFDRNPGYQRLSQRELSLFLSASVAGIMAIVSGGDPHAAITPYEEQALREEAQANGQA